MILGDLITIGSFKIYGFTLFVIAMFIFNLFYWHKFTKKNEINPIYTVKAKRKEFNIYPYMLIVPLVCLAVYGMSKYALHNPGVPTLNIGNLAISWYAICVLSGALATCYVSRWLAKKEKGKPEVIDALFIPSLFAGIIGARLWYVVSEWDYYMEDPIRIIRIWEGGLAIQGGVIIGAAFGIFLLKRLYKEEKILDWVDIVVPNILIAQAIGRWGNFFNQEVYGDYVAASKLNFLPTFITRNLFLPTCFDDELVQPLFLYESLLTTLGFVLITVVIRKLWKNRAAGSLGALYLAYYGFVRIILEPFRQEEYIMRIFGNISQSVMMSALFIIAGIGLLLFLNIRKKMVHSHE